MALENYRITEFQEKTQVDNGDYVLIDSATDGTHKYQLSRIPAQASAEVAAAVAAEKAAREAADAAEVTARNAAISAAISDEVTARNAAIAANVDNTLTVSGKAADAKKTGDEIADLKSAIGTDVSIVSLGLIEGALDGNGNVISGRGRWITGDYIPVEQLAYLQNNTSGAVYIDYYKYNDGSYTFVRYVGTPANTRTYIKKYDVTHIKLFSATTDSKNKDFWLGKYTGAYSKAQKENVSSDALALSDSEIVVTQGSLSASASTYGDESGGQYRARSSFIPVIAGVTNIGVYPDVANIGGIGYCYYIYDEHKMCIGVYDAPWSVTAPSAGSVTVVPYGSYIRLLFRGVPNDITMSGNTLLSNLANAIRVNNVYPSNAEDKITEDYYLSADGSLSITPTALTTELIKCVPGTKIVSEMETETGTLWMAYGIYTADRTWINRFTASTVYRTDGNKKYIRMEVNVPSDGSIGFVRFSYGQNHTGYTINTEQRLPLKQYIVRTVNHRGYNVYAPENTIPAFLMSKAQGFEWAECDVRITRDGVPVILHDATINRTAYNAGSTDISINAIDYDEAYEYDFGRKFSVAYTGTKIPTFEELISLCRNIGLNLRIELKFSRNESDAIDGLIETVQKYGMQDHVEWASFEHTFIDTIHTNHPNYRVAYIQDTINTDLIAKAESALQIGSYVCCAVAKNNTSANFALLAATGCSIDVYTISSNADISNASTYANSYTSDYLNVAEELYNQSI